MTDHREQAIKQEAEAVLASESEIGQLLYAHPGGATAYAIDTTEKLLAAEARVRELEAEREEQLSILTSVGPITCRNGKQHGRYDDCVYCRIEELEEALKAVKADADRQYSVSIGNQSAWARVYQTARAALQPKGE